MNMREKIARAIDGRPFSEDWKIHFWLPPTRDKARKNAFRQADAVLAALMEPTEEMISAADEAMRHKVVTGSARIETLKVGFLAMIHAAKEGE